MPQTTPSVKVMQTESAGGQVVLHGETFDEAYGMRELEQEHGLIFVHLFDDPLVAARARWRSRCSPRRTISTAWSCRSVAVG